jgi:hypothetical protein
MLPRLGIIAIISAGLGYTVLGNNLPVSAQTCYALRAVGAQSTQIEKKVSAPGTLFSRSNHNTDFAVPSEQAYSRFVTTVLPKNGGEYKIQMTLKYSNNTADQVYNQTVTLPEKKPFTISGATRNNATPYQVNVNVGGLAATGNTYKVSVCGM